jgi:hypothetical protein
MYLGYRLAPGAPQTGFLETTMLGHSDLRAHPDDNTLSSAIAQLFGGQSKTQASAQTFIAATNAAQAAFSRDQAKFSNGPGQYALIDVRTVREKLGLLSVGRPSQVPVAPQRMAIAPPFVPDSMVLVQDGLATTESSGSAGGAAIAGGGDDWSAWKDATVQVPNLGWRERRFDAPSSSCRLRGNIQGLTGGKRDLEALLFEDSAYERWRANPDGAPQTVRFLGRQPVFEIDVTLPAPGRYWLVLNNRFSLLTAKTAMTDLRVDCT